MRILTQLTAAMFLLSTAACVAEDDAGRPGDEEADWRNGGKADGQTCDFDAMSAADYYKQFAYEKIVTDSGSTWYRAGLSWDVEATLDNGDRVDLNVYFLANDRVILEYSEEHRVSSSESEVLNQTVVVTRARLDPTTRAITIDGVGTGTPLTVTDGAGKCGPSISFTFTGDLRSPGLTGDLTHVNTGLTSAYVIDPDHLDQVPNATARRYFEEDVASGKIKVVRK